MKLLTIMIREDKMQLPKQTEFGLKATINWGHILRPLKNTFVIQQEKCNCPNKQSLD